MSGGTPNPDRPLRVLASPASMPSDGNPYINLLYAAVRAQGVTVDDFTRRRLLDRYDVLHVNWPAALVRWQRRTAIPDIVKVVALVAVARARGTKLVWTAHDIQPHDVDFPRLHRVFFALLRRQVDLVVHLTASAEQLLERRYPDLARTPSVVVPHGHYRDVYPPAPERAPARAGLGLPADESIALVVGQIRDYKQVPAFVRAVLASGTPLHVAVAGGVRSPRLRAEIEDLGTGQDRCHLHLESLSPEELSTWVGAADVLVLPYSQDSALHSGVALLGLSFDRPVVVAPVAPMRDLQATVGDSWVLVTDGSMQQAVTQAWSAAHRGERAQSPDLSVFDWTRIGESLTTAFRSVTTHPG